MSASLKFLSLRRSPQPTLCTPAVYVASLALLLAALTVRYFITPWIGAALPFITVFGAVAAVTAIGGYQPAIATTAIGYLACAYLLVDPIGARFGFEELGGAVGLIAYLFTAGLIVAFGEAARRAQGRAATGHELLRVTLRHIGDGVVTTDRDGRITSMNRVAELLTGWLERDALGRALESVFRAIDETSRAPIDNPALRAMRDEPIVRLSNHTILIRKDGRETVIDETAAPLRDDNGQVSGTVLVVRDVTDRREREHQ